MLDLQKAGIFKRLGAYLLDLILLVTLAAGAWTLLCKVVDYDSYALELQKVYDKYEKEFGIDFSISDEEYAALSEEELEKYTNANKAMNEDEDALYVYNMKINVELMLLSSSILIAFIVLEIVIPLFLKNGRTVGKKVFGLAVMHKEGIRVSVVQVCFRALLGKYAIETMPVVIWFVLLGYGALGSILFWIMPILAMVQTFIVMFSQANCGIHDKLCNTVVVDYNSQMIFDCEEDLIAYKEAYAAERAEEADY